MAIKKILTILSVGEDMEQLSDILLVGRKNGTTMWEAVYWFFTLLDILTIGLVVSLLDVYEY